MNLVDDASIYLGDFDSVVVVNSQTGTGILDAPGQVVIDGMVMTTDYAITVPSELVSGVTYGTPLTVDGIAYSVKENTPQQDGLFSVVTLSKLSPDLAAPGGVQREWSLSDLSDVEMRNPQLGDRLVYNGSKWVDMEESDGTNVVDGGGAA